jgi:hypothetical protein
MEKSTFNRNARLIFYWGAALLFLTGTIMTFMQIESTGLTQWRLKAAQELTINGVGVIGISLFIAIMGMLCFRTKNDKTP